jgi:hypothetical protein
MFHHMVMFRFKPETTQSQIDAITTGLATLPDQIVELASYRFGPDAAVTDGSWDYGVVADFTHEADYPVYSSHPAHIAVIAERITPVVDEIARVQFRS